MEIVDSVSSKDTFSIIPFFENCERCLFHKFKKNWVYTEETLSIISIQTMENFEFMLKVSLQEIPSTIPKKMELYSDAFHNFKKIGFILKVSLQKRHFPQFSYTVENFEF